MGLRTGAEYLAGLQDGRQIIYDGRRIEDVTTEPGFRHTARAVAQYYDFQHVPEVQDLVSYETPDGDRAHLSFIEPRCKEDLRRRAAAFAAWAEVTCGHMGRSPDYMNACLMAVGAARPHWGAKDPVLGKRAYAQYLDARRRDLCYTHTFVQAHTDRFKPATEQKSTLRVVRETAEGPVVSGAKAVGTLAPYADANLCLGGLISDIKEEHVNFVISFTLPMDAPGSTWICRDVMDPERSHFDAPLASKSDEMDTVVIFEECLIPWEHVYVYQDVEIFHKQLQYMRFHDALGHHVLIRSIAKARFLFGLAHLIAETSQVSQRINIQERLGEFAMYLENLECLAIAAVEGAEQDATNGVWYANSKAVRTAIRLNAEIYPQLIYHLMQIGGSGYVNMPQERTLDTLGMAIEDYFCGATLGAKEKVALYRMGWDMVGSSWGQRHELYERFFFGEHTRHRLNAYEWANKDDAIAMVQRMLQPPSSPFAPYPLPERYRTP
jgi:4-hydroxyphenylacetate 3-monooxygenase